MRWYSTPKRAPTDGDGDGDGSAFQSRELGKEDGWELRLMQGLGRQKRRGGDGAVSRRRLRVRVIHVEMPRPAKGTGESETGSIVLPAHASPCSQTGEYVPPYVYHMMHIGASSSGT
jgi:hypothetical protein